MLTNIEISIMKAMKSLEYLLLKFQDQQKKQKSYKKNELITKNNIATFVALFLGQYDNNFLDFQKKRINIY